MASYEVKVTPTIDINMEKLKNEVRGLSKVINREAAGKLRLELDGRDAKQQAQKIVNNISQSVNEVQVGIRIDPRNIKDVEAEVRESIERFNKIDETLTFDYCIILLGE